MARPKREAVENEALSAAPPAPAEGALVERPGVRTGDDFGLGCVDAVRVEGALRRGYDDVLGRRFHDARTMTIKEGNPDEMDLLEVRTTAYTVGGSPSSRDVITSCRVPIPAGKRSDADNIVALINDQKQRSIR